jgi:hypothetical protein
MKKTCVLFALTLLAVLATPALYAAGQACTIDAGPIWNQHDAEVKCPSVCEPYGPWTGQWWTTVPGQMSVCQCQGNLATEEAGPIWNQEDADKKCPGVCDGVQGTWTGQWWTTVPGEMSVCQCSVCEPCSKVTEEAGPIWNQQDAEAKCPTVCKDSNGAWTGQWWTTVWGKMSVCQCNECP